MASFTEAVSSAAKSGICQVMRLGDTATAYFLLKRLVTWQELDERSLQDNTLYNQLYRWACNVEPPSNPVQSSSPFQGGQCPVVYRPKYTIVQRDVNGNVTRTDTDPGATKIWGEIRKPVRAFLANGTGSQVVVEYWGYGSGLAPRATEDGVSYTQIAPYNPNTASVEVIDISYIRDDGQPDDCGNPPSTIVQPPDNWNVYSPTITYTTNNNVDVSVPLTFVYGFAYIDVNANLTIPFTLKLSPTFNFKGTINMNTGDVHVDLFPSVTNNNGDTVYNFPSDNRVYTTNNNYHITNQPPPPPNGSGSNDSNLPPNPQSQRILKGVIVTVTQNTGGKQTRLFQTSNPDIWVPNLGFVQFKIQADGVEAWTADQPVKSLRSFIPCQWEGGAVDVRGTPQPGIQWALTPVYAATQDAIAFPQPTAN